MSARILIAGVGNVFLGDDGFGVELARKLLERRWPEEIEIADYGIRSLHLAFRLLDPLELLIVADAVPRGGVPGTLYVIEPELSEDSPAEPDAHGMNLSTVFGSLRALGGNLPRVLIVGCEPQTVAEGLGLSRPVATAVEQAVALIDELIQREHASGPGQIEEAGS